MFHVKQIRRVQMKIQKIDDVLESSLDLSLPDDNGTPLIDNTTVRNIFSAYSEFYVVGDFNALYQAYITTSWQNVRKSLKSMSLEYNPINNYDMTESGYNTVDHGGNTSTKTPVGDSHNTETRTINAKTNTKQYSTTYDNQNPRLVGYSETSIGGYNNPSSSTETVTTELGERYSITETHETVSKEHDGQTLTGDEISIHSLKRSGNIGVTTTQQMLTSEYEMRKIDIVSSFIYTFIDMYAFYVSHGTIDIQED